MDRDEVLEKSRAENKNADIYELEIAKQASQTGIIIMFALATLYMVISLIVGAPTNWGDWSMIWCVMTTIFWIKYIKLRRKSDLLLSIGQTGLLIMFFCFHINYIIKLGEMMKVH